MDCNNSDKFHLAAKIWFCPSSQRAAQELGSLSKEEREQVWADLTGNERISRFQTLDQLADKGEDSKQVAEALLQLEHQLALVGLEQKQAFLKAKELSPEYVNDPRFRLRFLRAEKFDTKAAAIRVARHFEEKRRLFGDELLGRDVSQMDLGEEDRKSLRTGAFQILPRPDHGGRVVLFSRYACLQYKEVDNMVSDVCFPP